MTDLTTERGEVFKVRDLLAGIKRAHDELLEIVVDDQWEAIKNLQDPRKMARSKAYVNCLVKYVNALAKPFTSNGTFSSMNKEIVLNEMGQAEQEIDDYINLEQDR